MTGSGPGLIFSWISPELGSRVGDGGVRGSTCAPMAPGAPMGMPVVVGAAMACGSSSFGTHPKATSEMAKSPKGTHDHKRLRTPVR